MKRRWLQCNCMLSAIEVADVEAAEQLIDGGFDVDSILSHGETALCICIRRYRTELVRLLLRKNCSLSLGTPNGNYPLHLAVHGRCVNLVEMLLNYRADTTAVNLLGKNALHVACENGFSGIAKVLIDRSSYSALDAPDASGRTPLMYACLNRWIDIVESLVQKGCRVNAVNRKGETPLFDAVTQWNTLEILKCLLDAGADVNHKDNDGESPLMRALEYSNFSGCREQTQLTASILIDHGSNVNTENKRGQTPLHYAVCARDDILVRKILNAGSKIEVEDKLGHTPLYYACRNTETGIVDLLIKGGANIRRIDKLDDFEKHSMIVYEDTLINHLIEKTKEMHSLKALCRFTIRKCFTKSIEKNAKFLPLPESLKNYIIHFDK